MEERNKVDANLIGELLAGEIEEWHVGVCKIKLEKFPAQRGEILVVGESGLLVDAIELNDWRQSKIDPGAHVLDTKKLAKKVNEAIAHEHSKL
jgi:hypothetical protein